MSQILYASTAAGGSGSLYILNQSTGAIVTNLGLLNDLSGNNYPITGMAYHPVTGVLYGSTALAGGSAGTAHLLVTIDPNASPNPLVTVIGSFGVTVAGVLRTMADIKFFNNGTSIVLYGVLSIAGNLYTINIATGAATVVGASISLGTQGGGLAIDSSGTFYGSPLSTKFGTYNSSTGLYTNITNPAKPLSPQASQYAAMAVDASDTIYAMNLASSSSDNWLVIISTTGTVTPVGGTLIAPGATRFDAIVFSPLPPVCIHPDMKAMTQEGIIKLVKDLKPNDLLRTANPIKPARVLINHYNTISHKVLIKFDKDSIAPGVPDETLLITSSHPIVIDGKLSFPRDLINKNTITRSRRPHPVNTYTIVTDTGKPVLINGALVATWNLKGWTRRGTKK